MVTSTTVSPKKLHCTAQSTSLPSHHSTPPSLLLPKSQNSCRRGWNIALASTIQSSTEPSPTGQLCFLRKEARRLRHE